MFKLESFAAELEKAMADNMVSNQVENQYSFEKVEKAVDYLNVAAELLDDTGHSVEAEAITRVLEKLAGLGDDVEVIEKEAKKKV